jgi:hypothetical protein
VADRKACLARARLWLWWSTEGEFGLEVLSRYRTYRRRGLCPCAAMRRAVVEWVGPSPRPPSRLELFPVTSEPLAD